MRQQLANGDALFTMLRELRPVGAHPFVVVEPAARVRECQRHGSQALGSRVDYDHRVALPRLPRLLVADPTPQIHNLLAAVIHTARAAQLATPGEVLDKRLADWFKAGTDMSMNDDAVRRCEQHLHSVGATLVPRRSDVECRRSSRSSSGCATDCGTNPYRCGKIRMAATARCGSRASCAGIGHAAGHVMERIRIDQHTW